MIAPEPIPCEPPLHMSYLPGSSTRLVVSIAGVGLRRDEIPTPEFYKIAHMDGQNHVLFVSDASRSWMNGRGVAEQTVAAVKALAERIGVTEICAMGNSMGGTAAMILATLTRIDRVLAVSPQFSVKRGVVPGERRWRDFTRNIDTWRFPHVPDLRGTQTMVTVLHGSRDDELRHALRFPADAGYAHFLFPGKDHSLARDLHNRGLLARIVAFTLAGRPVRARTAIRAAGGISRGRFERFRMKPQTAEAPL